VPHTNIRTYGDFTDGDLVAIDGEPGLFLFKYASVRNGDEAPNSVTVHGPVRDQHGVWRSFAPDRIKPPPRPRAKLPVGVSNKTVRAWAHANDVEVSVTGPVQGEVIAQYVKTIESAKTEGDMTPESEMPSEVAVAPSKARTERARSAQKTPKARIQPEATPNNVIRAWARANGVEVGTRGRIPPSVIDQYLQSELYGA
jgi:hypothetical protein